MYETEELKAKIVISGVLVFKDKDGEVVKEIPFETVQEEPKEGSVTVGLLPFVLEPRTPGEDDWVEPDDDYQDDEFRP